VVREMARIARRLTGKEKNDFIPENAGFLCRNGLYLRVDKLVFN